MTTQSAKRKTQNYNLKLKTLRLYVVALRFDF